MKNRLQIIGGLLIGVALGTAAGILMAPTSGSKTRNMLMKKSRKLGKEFGNVMRDSIGDIKDNYNRKVEEYASGGVSSINTLREKMKV